VTILLQTTTSKQDLFTLSKIQSLRRSIHPSISIESNLEIDRNMSAVELRLLSNTAFHPKE
jgi:hypothetical protein